MPGKFISILKSPGKRTSKASRTVQRPLNEELCPSNEGVTCLAIGMRPETAVKRFGHIASESTYSVSYDICKLQTQIYSRFHRALHSRQSRPARSLIVPFQTPSPPPPKNTHPALKQKYHQANTSPSSTPSDHASQHAPFSASDSTPQSPFCKMHTTPTPSANAKPTNSTPPSIIRAHTFDIGVGALTGLPLALTGARVPAASAFLCSRLICESRRNYQHSEHNPCPRR